ncbi:NYN domain-containing protein [Flavobacterium subsaxonicum]|uniref:Maebl n=1 Tax=Flavobacterium subsaxonicum WB 4.1-42 = DSM 21790 TaxID=1121898 RepID=A0A0A2MKD0_9FLAO|nr:NYN domain-containing protein [Flavobacterium subsaxonicum]KGO93097.1 Maebl [Flavobacterium subsaxonicum WB 4.1-42 = DSM 21790]
MDTFRKELRLAVLIDADNVSYTHVKEMLEEIAKSGTPTIKRIYADWTKPNANGWKNVLLDNAITPIQQYSYTSGKNSSDSALIIDAMDILYAEKVEGFCIVSSDSDFTRLAMRLREAGMKVIGIGEKKTPTPFITACDKFIYIEILKPDVAPPVVKSVKGKEAPKVENKPLTGLDDQLTKLLTKSASDLADDTGWTFLGDLGNFIVKKRTDFDPRNYGFPKLLPLIKSTERFEIDERETGKGNTRHIYIRVK